MPTLPAPAPRLRDSTLSPEQESILAFERLIWRRPVDKDNEIRARFGMSPASYYIELTRLIESDAAMAYDPLLIQRLQRRIAQHAAWHGGSGS